MFCPNCGNEISEDPCSVCGYDRSRDYLCHPTLCPVISGVGSADPEAERLQAMYETALAVENSEVMSHAEFLAADLDSKVVIETYVQAKQSWWEDKATVYTQDKDGAYFLYNMACSEADYAKLVPGTKIKVTGYKSEWSGEVEITDATFEIESGKYVAKALDVTKLLGTDDLIKHQNEFVAFKGMTVEPIQDADGKEAAFLYKWNGTGSEGDDLYFNASLNGETYNFTVESLFCDKDSAVYKAVKNLKIGDKIDLEAFLYWYEGVNPHVTAVSPAG